MGAEVTFCASQFVGTEDGSCNPLQEIAKCQRMTMKRCKNKKFKNGDGSSYHRDFLLNRERQSSMQKLRKKRMKKRTVSSETELDATEVQIKSQKNEIKLLNKQIDYLRKTNEQFIMKYGSFFFPQPNVPSEHSMSIDDSASISNTHLHYPNQRETLTQTEDQILSPLTPLTPADVSIIMGYSNNNAQTSVFGDKSSNVCAVEHCQSLKRLIVCLKWYEECEDEFEFLSSMRLSGYDRCLIDDYQHIVSERILRGQYQLIQNEIFKVLTPCHAESCDALKRFDELKHINLFEAGNQRFCIEFMDLIHCYLMHANHLQHVE